MRFERAVEGGRLGVGGQPEEVGVRGAWPEAGVNLIIQGSPE